MAVTEWTREVASTTGATTASITLNTITVAGASITDSTGAISFGDENLTTTGNFTAAQLTGALQTAAQTNITSLGTLTALAVDNITIDGNAITSTDSNGNITLTPNGTGDVELGADTVKIGDSNANVTLTTNGTGDLILNTNAGTNSSSITMKDGANGDIDVLLNGSGQVNVGVDGTGHDVKFFGDTASSYMLWDQSEDKLHVVSANTGEALRLKCIESSATAGPSIGLKRDGSSVADGDDIGAVNFLGENNSGTETKFGAIYGEIVTKADNANEGRVVLTVVNHNGSGTNAVNGGLKLTGKNDSTIDVQLGYGVSSNTTTVGDLTVQGDDVAIGGDADGTDRKITFGHTTLKSVMGIDDDKDVFAINTDASFEANNNFEIDANGAVTISSTAAWNPKLLIENMNTDGNPGRLGFVKNGEAGADSDIMGRIDFNSQDASGNTYQTFAYIDGIISEADHGDEGGKMVFHCMNGGSDTSVLTMDKNTAKFQGQIAFNNQTPAAQPNYTVSNKTGTPRTVDANGTLAEIGDNLAQLVDDLIAIGLLQ